MAGGRPSILAAMLVLALGLAGCGESEEEKFTNEVNEICRDWTQEIEGEGTPEEVITATRGYLADLKDVDPPDGKREDYDNWVRLQEEQIVPQFEKALRERDREALDRIDTTAVDSLADRLGLDDCD